MISSLRAIRTFALALSAVAFVAYQPVIAADSYDQYLLVLKKAGVKDADAQIDVYVRDNKIARIFGAIPATGGTARGRVFGPNSPDYLHIPPMDRQLSADFVVDGSKLKGSFVIPAMEGKSRIWEHTFTIDATVKGDTIVGTYTAKRATQYYERYESGYDSTNRPELLPTVDVSGTIEGTYIAEANMRKANWFHAGKSWPCYQGPNGNFSASESPSGFKMIDDPKESRRMWISEEIMPTPSSTEVGYGMRFMPLPNGGAAGPVVDSGLIYAYYYAGVGPNGTCAGRDGPPPDLRFNDAHDIVLCVDAATGKTVWKHIFPNKGLPSGVHKGELSNNTPVVADGRVYAMGSTALLYCLNARTGAPIWERGYPGQHEWFLKIKAQRQTGGKCETAGGRDGGHALCYAGGVLIACPLSTGSTVCGFDGLTGDSLWMKSGAMDQRSTPVRWANGGKEYVIVGGVNGIDCMDPRTGKSLWHDALAVIRQFVVSENHLIVQTTGGVTCFKITPQSATKAWSVVGSFSTPVFAVIMKSTAYLHTTSGMEVYELASGKLVAKDATLEAQQESNIWGADGRLFVSKDEQHGHFFPYLVNADPKDFRVLGGQWNPDLPDGTGYEIPFINPLVDGRIIIRVADGLQCWDLRKTGTVGIGQYSHAAVGASNQRLKAGVVGSRIVCAVPAAFATTLEVYNQQGRKVAAVNSSGEQSRDGSVSFLTHELAPGNYVVRFAGHGGVTPVTIAR